ncbi:unnamed protein product [Auanema sp. JU1783]|nr:unnamed protein product [Auanema sp. JU1783]
MFHPRHTTTSESSPLKIRANYNFQKPLNEDLHLRPEVIGVTLNRYEVLMCLLGYIAAMMTLLFLFEVIKPSQLFEL